MTDSERIAALVVYRMQQADEAVAAADLDLTGGFERAAVNRAYYAMFYAVLALLVVRKLGTSKHSAAISYFDLLYMKPALLPRELSAWLREAFAQRNEADYGEEFTITRGEVEKVIGRARQFVSTIRDHLAASPPTDSNHGDA